jgi:hypothetical protein
MSTAAWRPAVMAESVVSRSERMTDETASSLPAESRSLIALMRSSACAL